MSSKNFLKLSSSLALGISGAFIGSLFITEQSKSWFDSLSDVHFYPFNYLFITFPIVLIIFSCLALYVVWKKINNTKSFVASLLLFLPVLIFHIFWCFLFFYLQNLRMAFLSIIIMIIFLLAIMFKFFLIEKKSVYFLVPYLIWLIFILFLNYNLLLLN